ncbi:hypothetical protein [Bacterioplanoides pacificum]|uniref:Uncharacterized protein n=1 Tax=Bacterioplanoides pacificum TaxID=1171596 RepID=A0ABV7VWB7_9GAMM
MAGGEFCQAGKDLGWFIKRATLFFFRRPEGPSMALPGDRNILLLLSKNNMALYAATLFIDMAACRRFWFG